MDLSLGEDILRFLLTNARVLLALFVILFMWSFQHRSEDRVTPRYLVLVAIESVCPFSVYLLCTGFLLRVIGITWHFSG